MGLDVSAVRAAYPALADGYAYLDGAAGTQLPAPVIDAISAAHRSGLGNSDGAFPASARSDAIVAACRRAIADLVGGNPAGVWIGNVSGLAVRSSSVTLCESVCPLFSSSLNRQRFAPSSTGSTPRPTGSTRTPRSCARDSRGWASRPSRSACPAVPVR